MLKHKIQAHTRYAFASIGLMMLSFLLFIWATLFPMGLNGSTQQTLVEIALYAILLFAVLGGIFSIQVARLRKRNHQSFKI